MQQARLLPIASIPFGEYDALQNMGISGNQIGGKMLFHQNLFTFSPIQYFTNSPLHQIGDHPKFECVPPFYLSWTDLFLEDLRRQFYRLCDNALVLMKKRRKNNKSFCLLQVCLKQFILVNKQTFLASSLTIGVCSISVREFTFAGARTPGRNRGGTSWLLSR